MHFVVISIKLFFLCQPSACLKQQRSNTIWKLQLIQQHADPSVAQSALPLCASIYLPLSAPRGDESQEKGAIPLSTSHPILLHKDAHCTWQRNTAFVNHYLLINIYYVPLILRYFTVPVYNVPVFSFSFFFKSLSVTQPMTFDDLFQMGKTFNDIQVHIH